MHSLLVSSVLTFCAAVVQSNVQFTPSSLEIDDMNGAYTLQVKLDQPPSNNATVFLYLDSVDQVKMTPCRLQFNADQFNQAQNVTIVPIPSVASSVQTFDLKVFAWSPEENTENAVYHNKSFSIPAKRSCIEQGVCSVSGDPHVTTFQKVFYSSMGRGTFYYVLSDDGQFAIQGHQTACGGSTSRFGPSCIQAVGIKYGDFQAVIGANEQNNNFTVCSSVSPSEKGIKVMQNSQGTKFVMEFPDGSFFTSHSWTWNSIRHQSVKVNLSPVYRNKVRGLCGDFADPGNSTSVTLLDDTKGSLEDVNSIQLVEKSFQVALNQVIASDSPVTLPVRAADATVTSNTLVNTCKIPELSQLPQRPSGIIPSDSGCTQIAIPVLSPVVSLSAEAQKLPEIQGNTAANNTTDNSTVTNTTTGNDTVTNTTTDNNATTITTTDNSTVDNTIVTNPVAIEAARQACQLLFGDNECNKHVNATIFIERCISDTIALNSLEQNEPLKQEYRECCANAIKRIVLTTPQLNDTQLSVQSYRPFQCGQDNACNRNGVCTSTGCQCNTGFTGPECAINTETFRLEPEVCLQQIQAAAQVYAQMPAVIESPPGLPIIQGTQPRLVVLPFLNDVAGNPDANILDSVNTSLPNNGNALDSLTKKPCIKKRHFVRHLSQ
jgi:hypothetical protein